MTHRPETPPINDGDDPAPERPEESLTTARKPVRHWATRPPALWHVLAAILLCLAILYARSSPRGVLGLFLPAVAGSFGLACIVWPGGPILIVLDYLTRLITCISRGNSSWRNWRWYVTPICLAIAIHAWRTHWPFHMRWEHARPAFARVGPELLAGPTTVPEDREFNPDHIIPWFVEYDQPLGTYHVDRVAVDPDAQLVFFMTGGFFRADWGFLYNPTGREYRFVGEEVAPGWYVYQYSRP